MKTRLIVRHGGPLRVEGDVDLVDASGQRIDADGRPVILLCRCGASRCLPFCDGSHNRVGFERPRVELDAKDDAELDSALA
jgi:CDGSH-type Zn-finger protein